tara:strand:+ start:1156 stop:1422 length:267 start_codon:yes stop_codon:yes gene_type:complete
MSPQEIARLDLDAMQGFAEVAIHKSYTKAAQTSGVKMATIRNKFNAPETGLKVSLFTQSGRVLLPPKMQVFLEFIEEWKKKVQQNNEA